MSTALLIGLAALGGGLGAAGRFAVDEWVSARWRGDFPLGVFLVNVTGSLLLGLVVGFAVSGDAASAGPGDAAWFELVGTGVLGGYTTFSTATVDAVRLARAGRGGTALTYAVGTMLATVGAALLGLWFGLSTASG